MFKIITFQKLSLVILNKEIYSSEHNNASFIVVKGKKYFKTTKARARQLGFHNVLPAVPRVKVYTALSETNSPLSQKLVA